MKSAFPESEREKLIIEIEIESTSSRGRSPQPLITIKHSPKATVIESKEEGLAAQAANEGVIVPKKEDRKDVLINQAVSRAERILRPYSAESAEWEN